LLTSTPEGVTGYVDADLRDPDRILATAARTLDFEQPIALTLLTIVQLIPDADDPYAIVERLVEALPGGSYLLLSQPANDVQPEGAIGAAARLSRGMLTPVTLRSQAQIARFFDGLEFLEPGLVQVHQWRPDPDDVDLERKVSVVGGLARKP
jgi:S-adenosyl methyltransferase